MKLKELGAITTDLNSRGVCCIRFFNTKGREHRTEGPALMYRSGYNEWRVDGRYIYKGELE